jgi:Uma2 family endonuclease
MIRLVHGLFTRADWDRLPEGFPAQLIEGELVKEAAPSYGHQVYAMRAVLAVQRVVGPERALLAPLDVGLDDFNVYQPDVVVLEERLPLDARTVGIPLLVVEVLSASTARRDRGVKRRRLLAAGVQEVWLVDPASRSIECHDARGKRAAAGAESLASRALPGFSLVPDELFRP